MSKRILVADDEPHVLRVLAHSLEREGYEVQTVGNGADAYEYVMQAAPDVLPEVIERVVDIKLTKDEQAMFDKSVDAVKGLVEACKGIDEGLG